VAEPARHPRDARFATAAFNVNVKNEGSDNGFSGDGNTGVSGSGQ
jgi:hypothetical protein